MRKISTWMAVMAAMAIAGPALASDKVRDCPRTHGQGALSIEAMRQKLEGLGYEVRALEIEEGCFKARLIDRQSRGAVKALFRADDGELVRAKLDS
jgi:hypothetical protein